MGHGPSLAARSRDLRAVRQFRAPRQALSGVSGATQDAGQIAVIEDDGTIVTAQNPSDLPRVSSLNADTNGFFPALPADSGQLVEIIPLKV